MYFINTAFNVVNCAQTQETRTYLIIYHNNPFCQERYFGYYWWFARSSFCDIDALMGRKWGLEQLVPFRVSLYTGTIPHSEGTIL